MDFKELIFDENYFRAIFHDVTNYQKCNISIVDSEIKALTENEQY